MDKVSNADILELMDTLGKFYFELSTATFEAFAFGRDVVDLSELSIPCAEMVAKINAFTNSWAEAEEFGAWMRNKTGGFL